MSLKTAIALSACSCMAGVGLTLWATAPKSPPQEPVPIDTLVLAEQIQDMARLHSASLTVSTSVQGARGSGWIQAAAGEEILYQATGEVVAGVDLREVTAADITVFQGEVFVDLPPARIWSVTLNEDHSGVQFRKVGWVGRADPDFESGARREALRRMRSAAEQSDLLLRAEIAAEAAVGDLLRSGLSGVPLG